MSGRHPIVVCRRCGRTGPGRLATSTSPDLCRNCLAYERKPKTRCRVCGTVTVKRIRPGHDGDLCDDCVPGKHERVCGVCGRVGRLAVRATDTSPAVGDCCYRPPVATCSRCGREQPCYHAGDPQPTQHGRGAAHLAAVVAAAGCSRAASPGRTSRPSTCASAWQSTASPAAPAATAHCSPSRARRCVAAKSPTSSRPACEWFRAGRSTRATRSGIRSWNPRSGTSWAASPTPRGASPSG
jgi:hypothetical protein